MYDFLGSKIFLNRKLKRVSERAIAIAGCSEFCVIDSDFIVQFRILKCASVYGNSLIINSNRYVEAGSYIAGYIERSAIQSAEICLRSARRLIIEIYGKCRDIRYLNRRRTDLSPFCLSRFNHKNLGNDDISIRINRSIGQQISYINIKYYIAFIGYNAARTHAAAGFEDNLIAFGCIHRDEIKVRNILAGFNDHRMRIGRIIRIRFITACKPLERVRKNQHQNKTQ